jgi:hypothetical protein
MTADDPFSALALIAGPALLTNAATVLLLGTINRYARALDRARALGVELKAPSDADHEAFLLEQLRAAQRRVLFIVRALTAFYVAVGAFALGTLSYLVGVVALTGPSSGRLASFAMFATTMLGVLCLILGAALLAWEARVSFGVLRREAEFVRARAALRMAR